MLNTVTAIDPVREDNGGVQLLRGSHRLGRITHVSERGQMCADSERVAWAQSLLETVHAELEPGDVMFQHCNTLHCSVPNASDGPRTALLCSYNMARNNPFREHHHNSYTPLDKLPDSAVKERGHVLSGAERDYVRPETLENGTSRGTPAERRATTTRRSRRRSPVARLNLRRGNDTPLAVENAQSAGSGIDAP